MILRGFASSREKDWLMARALPLIGKKEKALIHVAKSRLGMSEEDYRAVLASVGVKSSSELNHVQLDEVMKRFEAGGFVGRSGKRGAGSGKRRAATDPKAPLLKKIGAILADTGLTWEYADGIARKMFGVQCAGWCDVEQLWKVAAALSIYQKRKRNRAAKKGERGYVEKRVPGADEDHA
jgi:phage gp16-like protein